MTILPYQQSDVVVWFGEAAVVISVRGDRVVVETSDRMTHLTTEDVLRSMQPVPVGRARDNLA